MFFHLQETSPTFCALYGSRKKISLSLITFRHLAVEEQREDIAIKLVEHGADLNFQNKVSGGLLKLF